MLNLNDIDLNKVVGGLNNGPQNGIQQKKGPDCKKLIARLKKADFRRDALNKKRDAIDAKLDLIDKKADAISLKIKKNCKKVGL